MAYLCLHSVHGLLFCLVVRLDDLYMPKNNEECHSHCVSYVETFGLPNMKKKSIRWQCVHSKKLCHYIIKCFCRRYISRSLQNIQVNFFNFLKHILWKAFDSFILAFMIFFDCLTFRWICLYRIRHLLLSN